MPYRNQMVSWRSVGVMENYFVQDDERMSLGEGDMQLRLKMAQCHCLLWAWEACTMASVPCGLSLNHQPPLWSPWPFEPVSTCRWASLH